MDPKVACNGIHADFYDTCKRILEIHHRTYYTYYQLNEEYKMLVFNNDIRLSRLTCVDMAIFRFQ